MAVRFWELFLGLYKTVRPSRGREKLQVNGFNLYSKPHPNSRGGSTNYAAPKADNPQQLRKTGLNAAPRKAANYD
jgi:hypothetical protein